MAAVSLAAALPDAGAARPAPSKRASDSCAKKVARLEAFGARGDPRESRTTRITEDELNSYLAIELKSKYHPSLKALVINLGEGTLSGEAVVDFEKLAMTSKKAFTRLLARMLSGTRTLSVRGRLEAADGLGSFKLDEAQFEGVSLPNILVEEIITAVGRKQTPPFDPMSPSRMPYRIRRVLVQRGYIDVIQ